MCREAEGLRDHLLHEAETGSTHHSGGSEVGGRLAELHQQLDEVQTVPLNKAAHN